jgi:hypothetical protein
METEISLGQLKHASERLKYHIDMFRELATCLQHKCIVGGWIHNAMIESFAINVRNLIVFFFDDPKQGDDAAATQFVHDSKAWSDKYHNDKLKEDFSVLYEARRRANKGVAHITLGLKREERLGKEYPVDAISNELELVIKAFLEDVNEDYLGERWDEWKKRNLE